jgi:hypothetical protein
MTHDPLCPHDYVPYKQLGPNSCQCELVAKVRDDQSMKAANRLLQGALVEGTPIFGCPFCPDIWESEPTCEHYKVAEWFADILWQPRPTACQNHNENVMELTEQS